MKKRLHLFAAVVLIVLSLFALTACGDSVIGNWRLAEAGVKLSGPEGMNMNFSMDLAEMGAEVDLSIEKDCTFTVTLKVPSIMDSPEVSETISGNWQLVDDKLYFEVEGEEVPEISGIEISSFDFKDGKLTYTETIAEEGISIEVSVILVKK